jgi:NAD(P)-dependent dehydrogenase (short-subunit alcohol dehydrogenase family)
MAGKLEGKIALVTGGSSGIGLATAQRFVQEGAFVYITGRRQAELDKAVKAIGKQVTAIRADASNLADLDKLFAQIKQETGRLDVVFANAGGGSFAPLGAITEEHYDQTFNLNVKGLLFTVQKALPLIPDGGSIILNASIVSIKGMPAFSVYSATKAAVRSFARSWTTDLKDRKIRVNVISPGPIDTPILDGLAETEEQRKGIRAQFTSIVPLGRMGQPDEIGKTAVFLASEDASFVAGVELFVDGGAAQI